MRVKSALAVSGFGWLPNNRIGEFAINSLPKFEIAEGRYLVRFARTPEEIDAALRLRFEVFNLELGEGLEVSYLTERDEDEFDATAHHLICVETETNEIIGTYRLQTLETAGKISGFYTSTEFRISDFPPEFLAESLEIGRACIAREHRHSRVLFLLWKGLAKYAELSGKRFLFGCCSLTSQDCNEGLQAARLIAQGNNFHEKYWIEPWAEFVCRSDNFTDEIAVKIKSLPKLFQTYLRFGAKVCSPPAIDRRFKTIDFLVVFEVEKMNGKIRRSFFSNR
jgi:putative hemolysin